MRKALRLGAALTLAASGLIVTAVSSNATPIEVIDCGTPPVNNPGVTVPPNTAAPNGIKVVGDQDPCAELVQTLVFVGTAGINNGVNLAGTGTGSGAFGPAATATPDTPTDANGVPTSAPHADTGGTFNYIGQCVMVNWDSPADSSAPVNALVTDCTFNTTNGEYHDPAQANPVANPIGAGLEGGGPGYQGLDWAPQNQASCISSSGSGTSSFSSIAPVGALDPTAQVFSSTYRWNNSLSNLRGTISGPSGTFGFDAKIQTQADPSAGPPEDRTAVGCLAKTVNALTSAGNVSTTGLNSVLVVGTATWNSTIPESLA